MSKLTEIKVTVAEDVLKNSVVEDTLRSTVAEDEFRVGGIPGSGVGYLRDHDDVFILDHDGNKIPVL